MANSGGFHGPFTLAYGQNLAQAEAEQKMAMMFVFVGVARQLVPLGYKAAKKLFAKMVGDTEVNVDEVFAQVEWPEKLANTDSDSEREERSTRRHFGFEDLQLTPDQVQTTTTQQPIVPQPTAQQPRQQQQQQQQQQQAGYVSTQVGYWDNGQQPRPIDSIGDQTRDLTEQMVQEDALARKTFGKAHSINQQTDVATLLKSS